MIEVRNGRIAEVLPNQGFANKHAARLTDPLPHVRFGEYVSFEWPRPELQQWTSPSS
jgi:hypothetical protein